MTDCQKIFPVKATVPDSTAEKLTLAEGGEEKFNKGNDIAPWNFLRSV